MQELISYLITHTQYFLDPSHFQLTFLQTLTPSVNFSPSESKVLVHLFEPALKQVMENFIKQLSGDQEKLSLFLLKDLFDHPPLLMQEFRNKKCSYHDFFLAYLSTHPEKISSLSEEQYPFALELIEKLENANAV